MSIFLRCFVFFTRLVLLILRIAIFPCSLFCVEYDLVSVALDSDYASLRTSESRNQLRAIGFEVIHALLNFGHVEWTRVKHWNDYCIRRQRTLRRIFPMIE